MLFVPKKYFVTAANAEGLSGLNAFDNALLKAGIGNVNLLRVSSILPPGAEYDPKLELKQGMLLPTAYGYIISEAPGETISAAVGVGISKGSFGVIMEFSGKCGADEAKSCIEKMIREAFEVRKIELVDMKIEAAEHVVKKIGCCLAAVPMV